MTKKHRWPKRQGSKEKPPAKPNPASPQNEDQRTGCDIGRAEGNAPPPLGNRPDTDKKKPTTYDQKRYRVEVVTLAVIGIYALLTFWQACTTQKIFSVAYRPYLGVSDLVAKQNTSENGVDIVAVIKNSGTVNATNSGVTLHILIDGVEAPTRIRTPANTRVIIPGGIAGIHGFIGSGYWNEIVSGKSTLDVQIELQYDGPEKTYTQCERAHFYPEAKELLNLGAVCKQVSE